jgi:anti-sigma factor RsiW
MSSPDSPHRETWELLPWYVNGTLEGAELTAVRDHLADCEPCREEVMRCRDLAVAVQTSPASTWAPSREHLDRLLQRIDSLEERTSGLGWGRTLHSWATSLRDMLWGGPPLMRWALAGQAALVVLLAGTVVWQAAGWGAAYRTLASPAERHRGQRQVRVVFADDATQAEMRAVLGRLKASIVSGPSPAGAYTIAVEGAPDQVGAAVDTLRASGKVLLAEPVVSR